MLYIYRVLTISIYFILIQVIKIILKHIKEGKWTYIILFCRLVNIQSKLMEGTSSRAFVQPRLQVPLADMTWPVNPSIFSKAWRRGRECRSLKSSALNWGYSQHMQCLEPCANITGREGHFLKVPQKCKKIRLRWLR